MIILRVLSRRAWTRESGTLFTTTISYRGQADYLTSDAGVPAQLVEKAPGVDEKPPDLDAARGDLATDVGSLPV